MKDHSQKRHIAKTITWRLVGTIDTIILSWIISGNPMIGLKIGMAEMLTKMLLYYFHERVWFKINLTKDGKVLESRKTSFSQNNYLEIYWNNGYYAFGMDHIWKSLDRIKNWFCRSDNKNDFILFS